MIIEVNGKDFEREVINSDKPVVVDFFANWCGPCRMLKPILNEISEQKTDYKFVSINIDEEDELADKFGISSIPCLVFFKDGKEYNRSIGLKPKESLLEILGE